TEHHQRQEVIPPGSSEDHASVREARDVIGMTRKEVISEEEGHPTGLIRPVDVDPAAKEELTWTELADSRDQRRAWSDHEIGIHHYDGASIGLSGRDPEQIGEEHVWAAGYR